MQELMQQASWNVCPKVGTKPAFSRGCYFEQDNTFTSLSGSYTKVITDLPDGVWTLIMRRDIFQKTSGSILDYSKVCVYVWVGGITPCCQLQHQVIHKPYEEDPF